MPSRPVDNRPTDLIELLDELEANEGRSPVEVVDEESKLVVTRDEAVMFELNSVECERTFATVDTAYQFSDLFRDAENVSLRFVGVSLEDDVLDTLRDMFSSVK